MEKFNQAINLLWPPHLEQKNITGERDEDENAVLTLHKPLKHTISGNCWNAEKAWRPARADC